MSQLPRQVLRLAVPLAALAVIGATVGGSPVQAQFAPPSTIFGSVTDQAGAVPPDLPIEAYIGGLLCGKGRTELTGDGEARVTVYSTDVSSREDKAGCGTDGAEVRIKIGDRFASQTARWKAGPVRVDITFGNVRPAAIPTLTPTATPPGTATPEPPQATTAAGASAPETAAGTIPAGSPGAGSPAAKLKGGVTSSTPARGSATTGSSDEGFPLWGAAILVLGAIAVVGGGVGYVLSRRERDDGSDNLPGHGPPRE